MIEIEIMIQYQIPPVTAARKSIHPVEKSLQTIAISTIAFAQQKSFFNLVGMAGKALWVRLWKEVMHKIIKLKK
ncbi:MAG: hypothetical protein ABIP10_13025 [Ferruginibacter sp.]